MTKLPLAAKLAGSQIRVCDSIPSYLVDVPDADLPGLSPRLSDGLEGKMIASQNSISSVACVQRELFRC